MARLTAQETAYLAELQAVLDRCPPRLGFYTIGDPCLTVYDRTKKRSTIFTTIQTVNSAARSSKPRLISAFRSISHATFIQRRADKMADFCRQCSVGIFGEDFGDLKGLITADDTAQGFVSGVVICEGCGPIQVDHDGVCLSSDCFHKHGKELK